MLLHVAIQAKVALRPGCSDIITQELQVKQLKTLCIEAQRKNGLIWHEYVRDLLKLYQEVIPNCTVRV